MDSAERVDELRPARDRAQLDAEAIRLLQTTLDKHRREVFETVIQPVRHMVTTTLGQLAGPRCDRLEFDEQLRPARVHPAGRAADVSAEPDELSFGTREQLMLLVRLTLGRLLSRSDAGRHCVILDDPLVNAALRRQQAALRLMEEAAREARLIVFTCHPPAYLSRAAKTFDLKTPSDAARPAVAALDWVGASPDANGNGPAPAVEAGAGPCRTTRAGVSSRRRPTRACAWCCRSAGCGSSRPSSASRTRRAGRRGRRRRRAS